MSWQGQRALALQLGFLQAVWRMESCTGNKQSELGGPQLTPALDPVLAIRAVYTVHVFTSNVKNAGTDAGITLEILGAKASSGRHALLDM